MSRDQDDVPLHIAAAGDDLDEAVHAFSEGYAIRNFRTSPSGAPFQWRYTATGDSLTTFRSSTFLADLSGSTNTGDEFIVLWNREGTTQLTVGGVDLQFGAGIPVVLPTDQTFEFHHDTVRQSLVHMSRSYLEAAASHTPDSPAKIRFDTAATLTAGDVQKWTRAMRQVAAALSASPTPTGLEEIRRRTADAMLAVFPRADIPGASASQREPARVRAATEFIHAYAHLPITPAHVAEAVGLSPRGLQQAFQRHLDASPTALLRAVRLDGARHDLLTDTDASVADTANRWGFAHLGRFASYYRERFGELPRHTRTPDVAGRAGNRR